MGAMENWGLVTYRTTAVLFDEGKSDARYKNRIAYVVAHGKFKFGDSVTIYLIYCYYLFLFKSTDDLHRTCPPVVWQPGDYGLVE